MRRFEVIRVFIFLSHPSLNPYKIVATQTYTYCFITKNNKSSFMISIKKNDRQIMIYILTTAKFTNI